MLFPENKRERRLLGVIACASRTNKGICVLRAHLSFIQSLPRKNDRKQTAVVRHVKHYLRAVVLSADFQGNIKSENFAAS